MDRPLDLPTIKLRRLPHATGLPIRATEGSACLDLEAAAEAWLSPAKTRAIIPTGLAIELPPGYVGLVCSRSGLAAKSGLFVLNAPGVIDADYRGEIQVILSYTPLDHEWPSMDSIRIERGQRIAQLLILPCPTFTLVEAFELSETARQDGGLGSTGL